MDFELRTQLSFIVKFTHLWNNVHSFKQALDIGSDGAFSTDTGLELLRAIGPA